MKFSVGFKVLAVGSIIGSLGWLILGTYYLVFFQMVSFLIKQATHYTHPLEMVPLIDQVADYIKRIDYLIDWMLYRNWLFIFNAIIVIIACIWMFFKQKFAWYLYWFAQAILALSAVMVMTSAAEFPVIATSTRLSCVIIVGNNLLFSLLYFYYFRKIFRISKTINHVQ